MRIYVAVTDFDWFSFLQRTNPDEVNFWRASTRPVFRALRPGQLFLFKLHSPRNYIVGGGVFSRYLQLPVSIAWESFGTATGAASRSEFINTVYREKRITWHDNPDISIGSIILTRPFFFNEDQWIPEPESWEPNIPLGKLYETDSGEGRRILDAVLARVGSHLGQPDQQGSYLLEHLPQVIPGLGSFSLAMTRLYHSQCAISGETALPALSVAQIRPSERGGEQLPVNGILLRKDLCELFRLGYITVRPDFTVSVSPRLVRESPGGKTGYTKFDGRPLSGMPDSFEHWPSRDNLIWHRDNVYISV
jgi:putative restriction endonuclease